MKKGTIRSGVVVHAAACLVAIAAAPGCDWDALAPPPTPAVLEVVSPSEFAGTVGAVAAGQPTVRLLDSRGAPMAGVQVLFSPAVGSGSVAVRTAVSTADGVASAGEWVLGTRAGEQPLYAAAAGLRGVTFIAHAAPGPVARMLRVGGDRQLAPPGAVLPNHVEVRVFDAFNNPVPGAPVTFTVAGGGSVDDAEVLSDANGAASARRWTLGSAGMNRVRAEAGSAHATFDAYACPDAVSGLCLGRFMLTQAEMEWNVTIPASGTLELLPDGSFTTTYGTLSGSGTFSVVGTTVRFTYHDDFVQRLGLDYGVWPNSSIDVMESGYVVGDDIAFTRYLRGVSWDDEDYFWEGEWVYRRVFVWPEK